MKQRPTTTLCRVADLTATGAHGVTLRSNEDLRHIVVVSDHSGAIRAYENRCPHLGIPLESVPHQFLDPDRRHLYCSMHAARFQIEDGLCVWGPCEGDHLTPVSIRINEDGDISLTEDKSLSG